MSNYEHPLIKVVTGKGEILCELFEDRVPNIVANVIVLAEGGFYEGMYFHRVIPGFMVQGGCPYTRDGEVGRVGCGGPGYRVRDEFDEGLCHDGRGVLSMANAGPDTNGSQFFITFAPTPHLDGGHAVFGRIVEGIEVLDALEGVGSGSGEPVDMVPFRIEVVRKNDGVYKVDKV